MSIKRTTAEKIFACFNCAIMILMIIITLYPIYYVIVCSFSSGDSLIGQNGIMLWPKGFSLKAYKLVFENKNLISGYKNTLILVTVGTAFNVLMTSLGAYVLSRPKFAIKKLMMTMIVFTMFFNGGLIPTFLLVFNTLNLKNSLLALILPTAINTWNLMIMKTNFQFCWIM